MNSARHSLLQSEMSIDVDPQDRQFRPLLLAAVQRMIEADFSRLVQLLYRIDVSEKKLKEQLALHPPEKAAEVITDAILVREAEKAAARAHYTSPADIPEDDRW